MRKTARMLALILASGMVLTACGGGSGAGGSSTTAAEKNAGGAAEAQAQQEGGNGVDLTVRVGPKVETIDPALNSAVDGGNIIVQAFETLLIVDQDNKLVPGQAEKYEISEDGLVYTFHLRDGLKWSDGSDLKASDFVFAWKRLADPEVAAPYGADMLGYVKGYAEAAAGDSEALSVSAPDDKTFVVELAAPCVYFEKLITHVSTVPVQPATVEANGDQWALEPSTYISNGPFKMQEWVPGSHVTFVKNENYWNAGAVTVNSLKFALMEDTNAYYNAFKTGELDLIKEPPTEEVPNLKGTDEFFLDPIMGTYYIDFNNAKAPFDNPDVRKALSLAIDREYVANVVMQGTYTPATNFVGPGISDAEPGTFFEDVTRQNNGGDYFDVSNHDADLAKAKELLAAAGYPEGQGLPVLEYMTNDASYHKVVAEYLQSCWKELGVTMDIKILEWSTFTPTRRKGDYQIARDGWVYDYDDPSNMLNLFNSISGNNSAKYNNPEMDKLLNEANSTADLAVHYQKLHEAENLLLEESGIAPVAYYNDFWMQKSNLKGIWHSPYGYWFFQYAYFE